MKVDAHHHFWDPGRRAYPWMGPDLAELRRPFGPAELAPLAAAAGVEATVLVQTVSDLGETAEFLQTAAHSQLVRGVVGWVPLADPGVADVLAVAAAGPGGERLVGIRHQVHDEPDADWLLDPAVERGITAVGDAGLVYDLLVRTRELPAALDTAAAHDGMRFVIDHAAKPPLADGDVREWRARLAPFADLDHVACKVSGLVTEADWHGWTVDQLKAVVDDLLAWFGPDRLMFGSDWPVCLLAASYEEVVGAASACVADLSGPEQDAVFGETARRWYGLS